MDNLAPIVLFVYNRPDHTLQTLRALQGNALASESELYIYSDAPKNDAVEGSVDTVREIIEQIDGFKKVTVIKQKSNKGLANSIINGVTEVIKKHGKVIVLEDDLVTSPNFLTFMNDALQKYKSEDSVWHISGWNYPIENTDLPDVFFWRTMNCWGWATWYDRWEKFEKNTNKLINDFSKQDIKEFNLNGSENFWAQVLANKRGKINTWAVYWYATIFKNKGFCINPSLTYVSNIGLDGSGEHCGTTNKYESLLNMKAALVFDQEICENKLALERICEFYESIKKPFVIKVVNKLSTLVLKKNIIK